MLVVLLDLGRVCACYCYPGILKHTCSSLSGCGSCACVRWVALLGGRLARWVGARGRLTRMRWGGGVTGTGGGGESGGGGGVRLGQGGAGGAVLLLEAIMEVSNSCHDQVGAPNMYWEFREVGARPGEFVVFSEASD